MSLGVTVSDAGSVVNRRKEMLTMATRIQIDCLTVY